MSAKTTPAPQTTPPPIDCPACGKPVVPENAGRVNVGGLGWVRRLYCRCKCGRQFRQDVPLNERSRPALPSNLSTR